jgi:hypothetical protein
MLSIGKSLEAAVRKIRPYLSMAHRRAFAAMVARGLGERREGEPIVCCDFANPVIDAVGGRYYFSLVRELMDAGYFPVFTACRATLGSFGTSRMKSLLLTERLGVIPSLEALKEPYFLITDRAAPAVSPATRIVSVSYEKRRCERPGEIAFPVFVHPQITTTGVLPFSYQVEAKRPARIFFGGNTAAGKYDKNTIHDVYGMLTRREMLDVAVAAVPAGDLQRPLDAAAWLESRDFHPFVLCETQHCRIPQQRWLEALGKADFFLACPGVGMPLCHNLIEALAAGCVPILQYAAYLSPPLRDRVNCLAFHDAGSLRELIAAVLAMSQEEIRALRANVRAHYQEFMAPGRFAQMLLGGAYPRRNLLMNAYRVPR